jgi:hypothetical protein
MRNLAGSLACCHASLQSRSACASRLRFQSEPSRSPSAQAGSCTNPGGPRSRRTHQGPSEVLHFPLQQRTRHVRAALLRTSSVTRPSGSSSSSIIAAGVGRPHSGPATRLRPSSPSIVAVGVGRPHGSPLARLRPPNSSVIAAGGGLFRSPVTLLLPHVCTWEITKNVLQKYGGRKIFDSIAHFAHGISGKDEGKRLVHHTRAQVRASCSR